MKDPMRGARMEGEIRLTTGNDGETWGKGSFKWRRRKEEAESLAARNGSKEFVEEYIAPPGSVLPKKGIQDKYSNRSEIT